MNTIIFPALLMNINYHTVALLSKLRGLHLYCYQLWVVLWVWSLWCVHCNDDQDNPSSL